jgi:riboflavin kinase/FMN adenylyltransferase
VRGRVREGRHLGRALGVPTANVLPAGGAFAPAPGVYVTTSRVGGALLRGVTSVGSSPTLSADGRARAAGPAVMETHLLGFDGDVYGEGMEVFFHKWVRGMARMADLAALGRQIGQDAAFAREWFRGARAAGQGGPAAPPGRGRFGGARAPGPIGQGGVTQG